MNVIERTSGYDPTDNICWYFGNKGDRLHRCQCPAHAARGHGTRTLAYFGRCRSGQRWFWSAHTLSFDGNGKHAEGFAATEAEAMDAAMAALRGFRSGLPILAHASHGCASRKLKELNKAKRLAVPSDAVANSKVVEYLYGGQYNTSEWNEPSYYSYYRFRILKRTKKRIFYLRKQEEIDEHGAPIVYDNIFSTSSTDGNTGIIDRQKLEAEKCVSSGHTWAYDWHLFASLEDALADSRRHDKPEVPVDLAALKAAMAAAHPDKGGSNAAFIEARARYVAARRAQRQHDNAASASTPTP